MGSVNVLNVINDVWLAQTKNRRPFISWRPEKFKRYNVVVKTCEYSARDEILYGDSAPHLEGCEISTGTLPNMPRDRLSIYWYSDKPSHSSSESQRPAYCAVATSGRNSIFSVDKSKPDVFYLYQPRDNNPVLSFTGHKPNEIDPRGFHMIWRYIS